MNEIIDPDDDWAAYQAEERLKAERRAEPPPAISADEFNQWRSPRIVSGGPVNLDNPLWQWLVRTRFDAWNANRMFDGPNVFEEGPMWCFDRYGQSVTPLADGRLIHIGGEHEDHYDPDFFIYNDVVVIDTDGGIQIHGYGREVFPPTDFHSATLIGRSIYIVGCLGHPEQRQVGATPVFVLDIDQMTIRPLATAGDSPGWIHRHRAALMDDGKTIVVTAGEVWLGPDRSTQENIDAWSLNVDSGRWERLTALDWQRWTMRPVAQKRHRLWEVRQERWRRDHAWLDLESHWKFDDPPNFEALDALYRIDEAAVSPEEGDAYNVYIAIVDGIRVRFTEEGHLVHAIVEGRLPADRLAQLQQRTLATLAVLDGSEWEIESLSTTP